MPADPTPDPPLAGVIAEADEVAEVRRLLAEARQLLGERRQAQREGGDAAPSGTPRPDGG